MAISPDDDAMRAAAAFGGWRMEDRGQFDDNRWKLFAIHMHPRG